MELEDLLKIKKKRGRKSKKELEILEKYKHLLENDAKSKQDEKPKKRGRKPKGGKIIKDNLNLKMNSNNIIPENIIVHLKCNTSNFLNKTSNDDTISQLQYNPNIEEVNPYTEENIGFAMIDENESPSKEEEKKTKEIFVMQDANANNNTSTTNINITDKCIDTKLKELKYNLHNNDISDKLSPCFWCTCKFENPPVYIPKHVINGKYEVYGCFCQPECATAHLFNENIDDSTKWERYALLNSLYKDVYSYNENFKAAPNPYYTLDKYMGNLTIEEYRNISRKLKKIIIVDKPLTKILPELHEENNEMPTFTSSLQNYSKDNKKQYKLYRKKEKNTQKAFKW